MAIGFDWIGSLDPVDDIGVVNVLFHNVVSAQPIEVEPVPDLILEFILAGSPFLGPNTSAVPEHTGII